MIKRINKDGDVDLEHCILDPTSYDLSRRKMPLYYKKLVVPMRMRSVYWKYFGFPANDDGTILTREKIVCIICKSQMIYNRNTSNLRMHLHSKHKNVFRKIEIEEGEKPAGSMLGTGVCKKTKNSNSGLKHMYSRNVDGTLDFNGGLPGRPKLDQNKDVQMVVTEEVNETDISNIAIIFPNNDDLSEFSEVRHVTSESTESSEINDAVVNFIITDLVPTDVVDGKGFNNLISSLYNKTVTLPSERRLTEDIIPELYESCKQQVYNAIMNNCISNLSMSIEEWQTMDGLKCMSIYMHYFQNGEPRLFTKLLTTVYCTGSETAQHWGTVLDKLFGDWNINSSAITGIVLASDCAELKTALEIKSINTLPCFLFVLQKLCSSNCFKFSDVATLLEKCRRVVKFIQELKIAIYDPASANELDEEDYDESDNNTLKYDNPHSWLTTYYMLRGLLRRKDTITQVLNDSSSKLRGTTFSTHDWDKIQDLTNVLKPLKTFVSTLFEEKNPSISLIKPITLRVNNAELDINEGDSPLTEQFKTTIKHFLNEAYNEDTVENYLLMATALDPRFRNYVQDEQVNMEENLITLLTDLIRTEGAFPTEESTPSSTGKSPTSEKKPRVSGINALFGSFCVNKQVVTEQDRVKLEVQSYQAATNASFEECPLEWWQHMGKKCPNLIRLAHRYHCIPATVIFNGCHSVKDYMNYSSKRASLNVNMIDPLLFLHANRVLF